MPPTIGWFKLETYGKTYVIYTQSRDAANLAWRMSQTFSGTDLFAWTGSKWVAWYRFLPGQPEPVVGGNPRDPWDGY